MFEELIQRASDGRDLLVEEMESAIAWMLSGQASDEEMGRLLLALRRKGESVSELVGAAKALRSAMTSIKTTRRPLLDTCGTGGDGAKTFNISTAAAIVAAAAGANVAKHGNRKITSATGSADVLAELGIHVEADRDVVEKCLDELGICFCFAPKLHPAMRHVAQVRRALGVPTLFNYLGPLCNPASAEFQVLGVGNESLQEKIAAALVQLPIQAALVVRGLDGMDEFSLTAPTQVYRVTDGSLQIEEWRPADFGFTEIDPRDLHAENPSESAAIIRSVLEGKPGPPREIVIANAAAGVWLVGLEKDLKNAVRRCSEAIDNRAPLQLLDRLAAMTRGIG